MQTYSQELCLFTHPCHIHTQIIPGSSQFPLPSQRRKHQLQLPIPGDSPSLWGSQGRRAWKQLSHPIHTQGQREVDECMRADCAQLTCSSLTKSRIQTQETAPTVRQVLPMSLNIIKKFPQRQIYRPTWSRQSHTEILNHVKVAKLSHHHRNETYWAILHKAHGHTFRN